MQILLISANRERMPYPVAPLGLAYIAEALLAEGHDCRAIDLCFSENAEHDLTQMVKDFPPDAIGISLRNLDNLTYPPSISYLPELEETIAIIRRRTTAPIIIGGSGFSLAPLPLMQRLEVDFGIVGEGEGSMVELVQRLEKNASLEGIPGVLSRGKDEFLPPRPLDSFGIPARRVLDNKRYLQEGGMANIQTKRGCPFNCIYCTYPLLEGKHVRVRDVGEVVRELKGLQTAQGVDYCYFVDDIFNYPPDYTEALLREMIAQGVKIKWTAFVNPRFLTLDIYNERPRPFAKVPFFVKNPVIWKVNFVINPGYFPACHNRRGITRCFFIFSDKTGYYNCIFRGARYIFDCPYIIADKFFLNQQVFGRVSGNCHFRKNHKRRARRRCLFHRFFYFKCIPGNIAYCSINLRSADEYVLSHFFPLLFFLFPF